MNFSLISLVLFWCFATEFIDLTFFSLKFVSVTVEAIDTAQEISGRELEIQLNRALIYRKISKLAFLGRSSSFWICLLCGNNLVFYSASILKPVNLNLLVWWYFVGYALFVSDVEFLFNSLVQILTMSSTCDPDISISLLRTLLKNRDRPPVVCFILRFSKECVFVVSHSNNHQSQIGHITV